LSEFAAIVPWTLFLGSLLTWWIIAQRLWAGETPLAAKERPADVWNPAATAVTVAMIGLTLYDRYSALVVEVADKKPRAITVESVQSQTVFNAVILLILIILLDFAGRFSLNDYGFDIRSWRDDLRDGGMTFLAAVAPVILMLYATSPLRSDETKHSFLKLLHDSPSANVVLSIALAVLVSAPLAEELMFRVVLQSALRQRFSARVSIGISSFVFCLVHGWLDGIALLPLALLLGHLYERRHSFLAIVVTHSLFNAWNLWMAIMVNSAEG
jgi:hypothetical protein